MQGNFVFNGRSREMNMTFSTDHQPSRDAIILDTRLKREARERERRRYRAALCVQRSARRWIARPLLGALAADALREEAVRPTRGLVPLLWDFEFIRRVPRRHVPEMRPFVDVLLRALLCSMRSSTLAEELSEASHAKRVYVSLILDVYAREGQGGEGHTGQGDGAREEPSIVLLRAVLVVLLRLPGRAVLLPPLLEFAVTCDAAQRAPIVALVRRSFARFTDTDVAEFVASDSGRDALQKALVSVAYDKAFDIPTTDPLDVLIGAAPGESGECDATDTMKRLLLEGMMHEVSAALAVGSANSVMAAKSLMVMGKLVRLMPAIAEDMELRRKWLLCLFQLAPYANKNNEFMRATVDDLCHPRFAAAVDNSNDKHPEWGCGCYRHGSTYLFSADYGLKLFANCATASLKTGTGASYGELDLFCSIFAWPLYNFSIASLEQHIESNTILSKLVHTQGLIRNLWCAYQMVHYGRTLCELSEIERDRVLREVLAGGTMYLPCHVNAPAESVNDLATPSIAFSISLFRDAYPAISTLFFKLMSYFIDATDFKEELAQSVVMKDSEVIFLVLMLKNIILEAHFNGIAADANSEAVAQTALTLLTKLHVIDEAQPFIKQSSVWITTKNQNTFYDITPDKWASFVQGSGAFCHDTEDEEAGEKKIKVDESISVCEFDFTGTGSGKCVVQGMVSHHPQWAGSSTWDTQERCVRLLQNAPFTIPFEVRGAVFTKFLVSRGRNYRVDVQKFVYVKRGRLFAPVFDNFSTTPDTPHLFSVRFINAYDQVEEGYGEGVYLEFLLELCKEGFAAEHGFFRLTDDGFLYPNAFSFEFTGDPLHLKKIHFLGAMVGRALRDGVLLDVPFALHFRNAILGRSNSINNLKTYDYQLYRHLMLLLTLSEEAIDALGLNFTYTRNVLGVASEVELLRGGRDIYVTRRNCLNYIHLVADFKLNREAARQTEAFRSGLECIVDRNWLRLFDSREVMKLFGGDAENGIDVEDWRLNTCYHLPQDSQSTPALLFWKVVKSMSSEQQKKLLKFSTSMNRPPLLGFRFLNPPFKLHINWGAPQHRLPSASTCFSTLMIPPYTDEANARSKIVAAIEETAEFGLA